jgi:hypothetical protein
MVRLLSICYLLFHYNRTTFTCYYSNAIGIKGAEALASYLMEVDSLQSLRLTSNRICNDGAIAMASVRLNYQFNSIFHS